MDRASVVRQARERLQRRVAALLAHEGPLVGVDDILLSLFEAGLKVALFGGALRDLALSTTLTQPRDLDLVVAGNTADQIVTIFAAGVVRRTRFGGFKIYCRGWTVDIWPLESTWAFAVDRSLIATFEQLPNTTLMNIEAVVAELRPDWPLKPRIIGNGLFEAIEDQTIELNFPHNPYPALSVIRAIVLARRISFALGPRLCSYILAHGRLSRDIFEQTQIRHYGRIVLEWNVFTDDFRHIGDCARVGVAAVLEPTPLARRHQ